MPEGLAALVEALLARHWWQPRLTGLAWVLAPLAALYGLLLRLHRWRSAPAQALPVPVLVVGNLIAGGAGKTPAVIAMVQALQAAGHRPGVVSRGHGRLGRDPREVHAGDAPQAVGDEPLLIRRRCRAPVWVGQDRPAAARALCAAHPSVDVIVADDGLQHRALARQAELIVFDERGAGNGMLLPAGPLRQPVPQQLGERARVLYSNGRQSTALPGGLASRSIERAWPLAAWAQGDDQPAVALQALAGRPLIAAAGIAAPEKFFSMLQAAGLSFAPLPLPDHHPFATLPWPDNAPDVVVTEKDAVKIARHPAGGTRVWVVPLDFQLPVTLIAELSALLFPERLHELRPPPDRPAGVPGVQGAAGDAAR